MLDELKTNVIVEVDEDHWLGQHLVGQTTIAVHLCILLIVSVVANYSLYIEHVNKYWLCLYFCIS